MVVETASENWIDLNVEGSEVSRERGKRWEFSAKLGAIAILYVASVGRMVFQERRIIIMPLRI